MNKQETAEAIITMQAWIDGATIQYRLRACEEPWLSWAGPSWDFVSYEYRTKPKSREWWINIYRDTGHSHTVYSSKELAIKFADSHVKQTIKIREVLE